jgi:hypothetical protein
VFLAGPYKGAPLSFAVITPAVSGPFDLGNVVIRIAINVDPATAGVTAVSDPLPQIYEGIPVRLRSIQIDLNRAGFTINPTNCDPFSAIADIGGDQGAQVSRASSFQVSNCATLSYDPGLGLDLSGGVNRRGHPAIHGSFAAKPGEANSQTVSVTLPKGEQLDNGHIQSPCTRVQYAADACPAGSVLGSAEATTPLLDHPLKGLVYLRASSHKLPDLAIDLKGQVDFELTARVDSVNGRLRTTFEDIPDAPVSSFALDLKGGSKGLLVNAESLCEVRKKAMVRMSGQNGASASENVLLNPTTCGKARHKRHRRHTRKAG